MVETEVEKNRSKVFLGMPFWTILNALYIQKGKIMQKVQNLNSKTDQFILAIYQVSNISIGKTISQAIQT